MFTWMKSTRSIAVVLVIFLVYILVIASAFGVVFAPEILALVGSIVTGVVIAYFGKRDTPEDQGK